MAFRIVLVETEQTVGNPDAKNVREYPFKTVDTMPHAIRIQSEQEQRLLSLGRTEKYCYDASCNKEFWELLLDTDHPYEFGNVYRFIRVVIASV